MTDKKDNVLDVFQVKLLENYDIDDYLHQDYWPNNCMEANNFFTYKVKVCWPEFVEFFWVI